MPGRRLPKNRLPTHPGEMLLQEFLVPLDVSQTDFAKRIGVSYVRLNAIIKGRRGVRAPPTPSRSSSPRRREPGAVLLEARHLGVVVHMGAAGTEGAQTTMVRGTPLGVWRSGLEAGFPRSSPVGTRYRRRRADPWFARRPPRRGVQTSS
ncbi:MAG: HigA family addiction module antitoxin [Longimicrobiales bacterium]|nr:HigA family addiction module antitoxin [Longimicrobiales bacterium]